MINKYKIKRGVLSLLVWMWIRYGCVRYGDVSEAGVMYRLCQARGKGHLKITRGGRRIITRNFSQLTSSGPGQSIEIEYYFDRA